MKRNRARAVGGDWIWGHPVHGDVCTDAYGERVEAADISERSSSDGDDRLLRERVMNVGHTTDCEDVRLRLQRLEASVRLVATCAAGSLADHDPFLVRVRGDSRFGRLLGRIRRDLKEFDT